MAEPEFKSSYLSSSVPNPLLTLNYTEINVKRPAFLFCFWSAVDPWIYNSSINSTHICWAPIQEIVSKDGCHQFLPSLYAHVTFVSPSFESWLVLSLLWPIECSRSEIVGLLSPGLKRIGSFCFLPLQTLLSEHSYHAVRKHKQPRGAAHVKTASVKLLASNQHQLLTMRMGPFQTFQLSCCHSHYHVKQKNPLVNPQSHEQ